MGFAGCDMVALGSQVKLAFYNKYFDRTRAHLLFRTGLLALPALHLFFASFTP